MILSVGLAFALLFAEAVLCSPGAAQGSRVVGAQMRASHSHEHGDMREHAVHASAERREVESGASLVAPCPCGCGRASGPAASRVGRLGAALVSARLGIAPASDAPPPGATLAAPPEAPIFDRDPIPI